MNHFNGLLGALNRNLRVLLAAMMVLLVADVSWQVLTRFILAQPSSFTEEIARFLLIWISLLGGAYAYWEHSHLGFDLIVRNISAAKARFIFKLCCVLVAIFAVTVLIVGGSNLVRLTWVLGQQSAVLGIPMAAVYVVLPVTGVLFLMYSVYFLLTEQSQRVAHEVGE
ncbi:TRAP transporter small permease [Alteromonas aestuariivivens]|uniref:TRAP transporter small permease protein n=1 Tax=Alteromonas aestuariivivens TaxID=1938339 RepID=A0A3D8M7A8_9ALTE|nr:TRAP transporter small permease [Alteromonas aestuariivivens]RDV25447.1 TRAP transporter small permease [Alteromonas aestuariivivens]